MALDSIGIESEAQKTMPPTGDVIVVEDLWRTYDMGAEQQVHALRGINLRIQHNEYVAVRPGIAGLFQPSQRVSAQ